MPIAALASSPVERSVKNFVGSRNSRSQTAGWSVASIRPSIRSRVRFCSSMKAADTTLLIMTASETWTISAVCAFGTNSPSTLPVAIGTSAPMRDRHQAAQQQVRAHRPRVPRRLNRSSRSGLMPRSGSGR